LSRAEVVTDDQTETARLTPWARLQKSFANRNRSPTEIVRLVKSWRRGLACWFRRHLMTRTATAIQARRADPMSAPGEAWGPQANQRKKPQRGGPIMTFTRAAPLGNAVKYFAAW